MIEVFVYGTPSIITQQVLKNLRDALMDAVKAGIQKDYPICVFFPPDRLRDGLGEEIVVHVKMIPNEIAERTQWLDRPGCFLGYVANMASKPLSRFFPDATIQITVESEDGKTRRALSHVPTTNTDATAKVVATLAREAPLPHEEDWIDKDCPECTRQTRTPSNVSPEMLAQLQADAPNCDVCGTLTTRSGTCYKCLNCGNSMGCS